MSGTYTVTDWNSSIKTKEDTKVPRSPISRRVLPIGPHVGLQDLAEKWSPTCCLIKEKRKEHQDVF